MTIGIIGFGAFGKFFGKLLQDHGVEVIVHDSNKTLEVEAAALGITWGSFEKVAAQPILVLAVPLSAYKGVAAQLSRNTEQNLIWDVCSVKMESSAILGKLFPGRILVSHPLFGPQSAKNGTAGLKMVVCPPAPDSAKVVLEFCKTDLGLNLIEMSPGDHDEEMAMVQGLTHFVVRALKNAGVKESPVSTRAFNKLVEACDLVVTDSWELYTTIQLGNPRTAKVRQRFLGEMENVVKELVALETKLKGGNG